ncbi:MAG: hypothetical protein JXR37_17460 [Kiritimatiellae bacterium]|nr:hypothetical protein [Kiritimatiellia bacterium]
MKNGYFHKVSEQTPTRLWVNNPTTGDAKKAIAAGAVSCTTNPTYVSKMLQAESDRPDALAAIDEAIARTNDDRKAAALAQQTLVARILELFLPLHEQSNGQRGFVSIQGDPYRDREADHMVGEALDCRQLPGNFISKIPATEVGLDVMARVLEAGIPVIATEVMSIAQAKAVCELQQRVAAKGPCPPLCLTHITGIYDEYLAGVVAREGVEIDDDVLRQAGCIVARRQFAVCKRTGADFTFLGGGARAIRHFTEMVGGDVHVTINYSMAADIVEQDPPVTPRFDTPADEKVVAELRDKLTDFRKAYDDDGLPLAEFEHFGPVAYFRDMFVAGWDKATAAIADRRADESAPGKRLARTLVLH